MNAIRRCRRISVVAAPIAPDSWSWRRTADTSSTRRFRRYFRSSRQAMRPLHSLLIGRDDNGLQDGIEHTADALMSPASTPQPVEWETRALQAGWDGCLLLCRPIHAVLNDEMRMEGRMTSTCVKCGGLLIADRMLDFYQPNGWRCVNCGSALAETVLRKSDAGSRTEGPRPNASTVEACSR
jgi:hypothetical protein